MSLKEHLETPLLPSKNHAKHDVSSEKENSGVNPNIVTDIEQSSISANDNEHDDDTSSTSNVLNFYSLLGLVYTCASGGPYGLLPLLRAGGNFAGIMGLILSALVFAIPEAVMTAELGSSYPDPSGGTVWVEKALGKKFTFIFSLLCWIGLTSNIVTGPHLFLDNSLELLAIAGWGRFGIVFLITTVMTASNFLGIEIVGSSSGIIGIIGLLPFVIMFLIGAKDLDPKRWLQMPDTSQTYSGLFPNDSSPGPIPLFTIAGVFFRPYLSTLYWNTTGYSSAAAFTKEVKNMKKTFPKVLLHSTWISTLSTLLPILIVTGIWDHKQSDYQNGGYTRYTKEIGGPVLGTFTLLTATTSVFAAFESNLSSASYFVMGLAERGYLPKLFTVRHERSGTPIYGLLLSYIVTVCMGSLPLNEVIMGVNLCGSTVMIFEYLSYLIIRYHDYNAHSPFRLPIPFWGLVLFLTPPLLGSVSLMLSSSWLPIIFISSSLLVGVLISYLSYNYYNGRIQNTEETQGNQP